MTYFVERKINRCDDSISLMLTYVRLQTHIFTYAIVSDKFYAKNSKHYERVSKASEREKLKPDQKCGVECVFFISVSCASLFLLLYVSYVTESIVI